MRIAFYFAETFDWNDEDLEGAGLGGAETALVHLGRAFARAGQEVTIFNRTSRPGTYRGVWYRHCGELGQEGYDVFVSMSYVPGLAAVASPVKVHLSMEDSESWVRSYRDVLPQVQALFTLSPHHTRMVRERFGVDPSKVYTTRLGVDPDEYADTLPKVPGKLIYCSVPDCGLGMVAPVYRRVRARIPWASLVITGDFTLWGRQDPGTAPYRPLFERLPGVRFLGKVPRAELIRHQKTSDLHLYPCLCNELFCLASIECQAAGTPTVGLAMASLPTTVEQGRTGLLVNLSPHDPRVVDRLAGEVASLLQDRERLARLALQARGRALRGFSYDRIAAEWLEVFQRLGRGTSSTGGA